MQRIFLGALVSLAGCASIETRVSSVDTLLSAERQSQHIASSTQYTVVTSVDGERIVLVVSQADRCAQTDTLRHHRTTHMTRVPDTRVMTALSVVMTVFGVAGAYGYIDADNIAQMQTDSGTATTPAEVRASSIVAMGIAGASLLFLGANVVRARDSDRDDGIITASVPRGEVACNEQATRAARVVLELGGGTLTGDTDEDGRAAISLVDVPGAATPYARRPFGVVIGSMRVMVALSDSDVARLRAALAGDPSSRWSRDCDDFLREAAAMLSRGASPADVARLRDGVGAAAQLCTSSGQQAQARALRAALDAHDAQLAAPTAPGGDALLGWACAGNSKAKRFFYGALACVGSHAGEICSALSSECLHRALERIAFRLGLPAFGAVQLVKWLGIEQELTTFAAELCTRLKTQVLPHTPTQSNPFSCLDHAISWTASLCTSMSLP